MIEMPRNNEKILLGFDRIHKNYKSGLHRGFDRLGRINVKQARLFIRKPPKTGLLYRIKGRKRLHRASKAGESPANLFGNLARSIGFQINGMQMQFATYGDERGEAVQSGGVSYGGRLEIGMNRPFLIKTVKKHENQAENILNDEMFKATA